jgi:hypothetical protein
VFTYKQEITKINQYLVNTQYEEILAYFRSIDLESPTLKGKSGIIIAVFKSLAGLEEWVQFTDLLDRLLTKRIIENEFVVLHIDTYYSVPLSICLPFILNMEELKII